MVVGMVVFAVRTGRNAGDLTDMTFCGEILTSRASQIARFRVE